MMGKRACWSWDYCTNPLSVEAGRNLATVALVDMDIDTRVLIRGTRLVNEMERCSRRFGKYCGLRYPGRIRRTYTIVQ